MTRLYLPMVVIGSLLLIVERAAAVELQDILVRSLVSQFDDPSILPADVPGNSIVVVDWQRQDRFLNNSTNLVATITGIEMIALDPSDVGFADIFGGTWRQPDERL